MARDNVVICYEGIQRVYRNAVVRFLREKITTAFPTEAAAKIRSPFQKEWESLQQNASMSRLSGEVTAPIADDFDLLSVNHFFNLFDLYYDSLFATPQDGLAGEVKRQKQTLLNWIKKIKDLRDPLSHPTEADFSAEDAFVLLDCAKRVLIRIGVEDAAEQVRHLMERLLTGPPGEIDADDPLEDRLPPKDSVVVDFIGRHHELEELWAWLSDPAGRRWALAGEGGKGKSALAYSFALDVKAKAPRPFQTVLWLSAKRRTFTEGNVIPIARPDFSDLDTALSCLLTAYGWLEETTHPLQSKKIRVLELFMEFPALLIVDDIDSLESENERVIEFFSMEVPTTHSKVLFTSRRTIFGLGGTTTHVGGFNEDDAAKFIFSRCELMELDPSVFNKHLVRRIVKVTEGSPLYIEDLLRLTASVRSADEAVKSWEGRGGKEARKYALGRECDLLSSTARRVLMAASLSNGAVSFTELEEITGCPSEAVTTALQELQKLFLVPKPRLIEGEQRFDVNVNTRALVRDVYGTSDGYRRMSEAYRTILKGVPHSDRGEVGAIIRQAIFLLRAGRGAEAETVLSHALEQHPSNPSLLGVMGVVYKAWTPPRITDAREKFNRAWQLRCARQETYEHWCRMELREREWTKAAEAAQKGLKILPNNRLLLFFAGHSRGRLAKELIDSLHEERGGEELRRARELLEQSLRLRGNTDSRERVLDAEIYRSLVLTCELLRDLGAVRHYARLWRSEHPNDRNVQSELDRLKRRYRITV